MFYLPISGRIAIHQAFQDGVRYKSNLKKKELIGELLAELKMFDLSSTSASLLLAFHHFFSLFNTLKEKTG